MSFDRRPAVSPHGACRRFTHFWQERQRLPAVSPAFYANDNNIFD